MKDFFETMLIVFVITVSTFGSIMPLIICVFFFPEYCYIGLAVSFLIGFPLACNVVDDFINKDN